MGKKYVLDGYTTPAGVTDAEGVKKVQQMLGVKADGVWGPQTQRAYNARMDGISEPDYPNNEKNARMRDVSPAYNFGGSQYKNILGISDPYFSGGDSFVAYADYLNERAQRNKENNGPTMADLRLTEQRLLKQSESRKKQEELITYPVYQPSETQVVPYGNSEAVTIPAYPVYSYVTMPYETRNTWDIPQATQSFQQINTAYGYVDKGNAVSAPPTIPALNTGNFEIGKMGGTAMSAIGNAIDAYNILGAVSSDLNDDDKRLGKKTVSAVSETFWSSLGGALGTSVGVAGGAAIGTLIFPGLGTLAGAIGGALFGMLAGELGSWAGKNTSDYIVDAFDWKE